MYHIPDDRRAQRSAAKLGAALLDELAATALADVSVADLTQRAGVGRATFYRLFDTTIDILAHQADSMLETVARSLTRDGVTSFRQANLTILSAYFEQSELIEALWRSGRMDLLYRAQIRQAPAFQRVFARSGVHPEREQALNAALCALMPPMLDSWVRGGRKDSPEQLYRKLQTTVSDLTRLLNA